MSKRRRGDRIDAKWVRGNDPMHFFLPYIYPNRADNEAVVKEQIDLTALNAYLEKKNAGLDANKYTLFHAICQALVHTITLRPKMNYFIKGHRIYQRNDISLAFVVKKQFHDNGQEALAFLKFGADSTINTVHDDIMKVVHSSRSEGMDATTNAMNGFTKIPRWLMRIVMKFLFLLDYYGRVPQSLIAEDPNHATVFISNLGSIGLSADYHHLFNWGTCSIFLVIGEKHWVPVFSRDGSYEMHEVVDIAITLDERIADGFYYAKTIALFKHIMQHPELLDTRADQPIEL
ncbi:MAG: 2-oxo acid dehydrogenase subunit E2 [Clostridia bacterium]|nr:2-oxo acid dehydrogenase subunit E2 [Clostridia bacterium]MBQ8971859.1 2-oxo acid dehydrogenase subunit E2 [Clostridia bacterium]